MPDISGNVVQLPLNTMSEPIGSESEATVPGSSPVVGSMAGAAERAEVEWSVRVARCNRNWERKKRKAQP